MTESTPTKKILVRMPMELRWRDLDAFNHVNNSNFMTYLEEARIRWFESTGKAWITEDHIPLLAAVQMNYRLPIPYPSQVFVELFADRVGNTSVTLGHRNVDTLARVRADRPCGLVWIDRHSGRPIPLPEAVRASAES